ncbi:YciI family protein [Amycolatopsis sp. PS_44_ISF1]|uniref:YciI family protein n=1 Tax=Amycolatopsis sp. PS_44_ISF1 TaxID=2974917 RepID=UPI0028E04142|nr:YciI family protein [Amycolatopsis sp. PS_44_ISF1]MDT8911028.1 YciI family protein [Amycolatopsis sp. PS_44_ISF1]
MRFMVMVKASPESEAGRLPSERLIAEMTEFNDKLAASGHLLSAEGLTPSSQGARLWFSGEGAPEVIDGPFAETKELVAGLWILRGESLEEIVELMKRAPNPDGQPGTVEIRPLVEVG